MDKLRHKDLKYHSLPVAVLVCPSLVLCATVRGQDTWYALW